MGFNPIWSSKNKQSGRRRQEKQPRRRTRQSFIMEALEPRHMMAGPQLQSILPNEGADLLSGAQLTISPQELVFHFTQGQTLDSNTLGAIRISRSVNGTFGDGNDQLLVPFDPGRPGFVGLGDQGNEVIVRFPSALPDDLYRVTIVGDGAAPLRNIAGNAYNSGTTTTNDFRLNRAPELVAVVPQPVTSSGGVLTQARDQIDVYFNANDPLDPGQAQNPGFYQLLFTNDTATSADDQIFYPINAVYDATTGKTSLTFQSDLALLPTGPGTYRLRVGDANAPANLSDPMTPVQINPATEPGSSFDTANVVGALSQSSGTSTVVVNAAIDPQPFALPLPGGNDEPGHRNIPAENHLLVGGDATQGISTIFYNFQTLYGFDPQGNPLSNGITSVQRQRVREIFEFYGHYLGAQFAETANQGITVAVGDLRAVDPTLTNGPGGTLGVTGSGVVVMDSQEPFGNSEFGGFFFNVAMHEIGHALGLGHDTELPDLTVMSGTFPGSFGNTGEEVFPGDYDIVHGQHLYRPESKDIDLYQFQLNEAGVFTAETMAERLPNSSLLDSAVTLFEQYSTLSAPNGGAAGLDGLQFVISDGINPDVTFELDSDNNFSGGVQVQFIPGESAATIAQRLAAIINTVGGMPSFGISMRAEAAGDLVKVRGLVNVSVVTPSADLEARGNVREILGRNDDYFSEDSYLQLHLGAGRYYIGVTSTGNTNYDPVIADSGFGGTTQGVYQLRLNFARDPLPAESILDTSGLALDGDGDGRPGGAFNYWFNVATESNTLYVDKSAVAGGDGSLLTPFNEIDLALAAATARNADANPTNNVRIVRLAANGGTDGNTATVADAIPYAVGFNTFGQTLADGRALDVPKGVTLTIDAGAVVKMRGANIDVGSVAQGIDRSEGYLQVLGIPGLPAVITSTRDETLGQDVEPSLPTVPSGGDWGGLVFRNDEDLASPGRRVLEREGIFLNYVNGADIRYGGGTVTIGSVPLPFNAIHMIQARPTISHSTIVGSANAAMSADLPSFQESKFYDNSPGAAYTADYDRVGPDIYGNTLSTLILGAPLDIIDASNTPNITITTAAAHGLTTGQRVRISGVQGNLAANGDWTITVTGLTTFTLTGSVGNGAYVASAGDVMQKLTVLDNSLNGLFVRIRVVNNSPIDRLTVAGRFDDTDITHIITQALIIQGTPGGPVESATPGVFTARTDASLTIDPGIVIKSQTGRIEAQISTQVLAEGTAANPIIFTSLNDDRYGRGGSFDTNADRAATKPTIGSWSGLFFDRLSHGSVDHAVISYGGGASLIEGRFENFSPIEINQADVRIAKSMIRDNDATLATSNRNDRGTNAEAVIFVRGAQPVIVNNTIRDNDGQAININANSLDYVLRGDTGRSTGAIDLATIAYANHGPLVDGNRMRNNQINGMIVRGAVLTNESIWDDTDVVHVLFDEVEVANHHTYSGLRLQSNPDESLVIKLQGAAAGFTAGGRRLDISDRIGGTLQVVGTPQNPVVMTAISDDSVGAGLDPDGAPLTDTNEGFRNIAAGTGQTNPIFTGDDIVSLTPEGAFTTPFSKWGPAQFGTGAVVTWAFMGAGVSDSNNLEGGWTNTPLANFMPAGFANEIRRAFAAWSAVANITFVEVTDTGEAFGQPGAADIRVGGHNIDGAGGTLAHGFLPNPNPPSAASGDLHFDTGDQWKIGFGGNPNAFDIFYVATHELGHAIGLGHTGVANSLMNPFYGESFTGPQADDIAGAVFLYGLPPMGTAGAWRSVRLEQFSNDRNVVVANELENATATANGNDSPGAAQFVGALATDEKNSNETLRLGFEIHGYISLADPSDEDVYSFNALTGTEVWFDIDRTTQSLDTVLELVDANGTVLARSDDSTNELATGILPPNPFGPNLARLMQRDAFNGDDLYTINPRDAGMRVVLPGAPGLRNTYYIRVRSKGLDLDDPEGLTRGAYQLQIRLREADEVPGSMIRNSDIRFATNGIEALGMPDHSPLTGDASETTANNDTLANAQDLGNLLTTDRSSLSVAGNVTAEGDIDFFRITVDYDLIQSLTDIGSWATMFDIDYADGVRGGDLTLSVFDANGNLLLVSRDSNVEEDQPGPGQGLDMDDLSRGSGNPLDPFIGAVQLPEGASRTYFIAVSSNRRLPTALNATFQANATSPLVRLEPVSSVRRLVEDHIGSTGGTTAAPSGAVFAGATPTELNLHADQFQLGDVVMFVNSPRDLFTVDPLTGIRETDVTGNLTTVLPTNQAFRDISMRSDGRLFGFVSEVGPLANLSDANTGLFVEIDPGTGQILRQQDDGVRTLEIDPTTPPQPGQPPTIVGRDNGVSYDALDFYEPSADARRLFAVGTVNAGQFSAPATNQLYELDPYTGVVLPDNFTPAFFPERPPSEPLPRATLDVGINGVRLTVVAGSDVNLGDGDTFDVDEGLGGGPVTLEMDSGITLNVVQPGIAIADGATFTVTDGAATVIYRFDKDPATAPPSGIVEVSINDTMSAAQVAGAIASAFLNGVTQTPGQPLLANPLNNQLRAVGLSPIGQPTRVYIEDLSPNAIAHNVVSGTAGVQVLGAPNTQTPGALRVYFTPLDTAAVIAQRIEVALAQSNPFVNVVAVAQNNSVAFQVPPTNPTLTITIPATTPFTSADLPGGFGGIITGMQFLDNNLFAVTNTGTLLRYSLASINGPVSVNPVVQPDFAINLNQVPFTGLSLGPQNLDVDRDGVPEYARTFFATAADGRMYAFDEFGSLQGIFANGATSIPVGGGAQGLAFSTLDYNLWHVTDQRGNDAGHGINPSFDNSRTTGVPGGTSFYFGLEDPTLPTTISTQPGAANYAPQPTDPRQQNVYNTYNLPGGAQGSLTTDTFSLAGYTSRDLPTLYFNYFLQTENANANLLQNMRDAFRVFISNDGVNWSQLATNNSILSFPAAGSGNALAELPDHLSTSGGFYRQDVPGDLQRVQELFDNTNGWRQARVDLGDFAGLSNLRLRFDFSTAATMNVGGLTVGQYLQALPGAQLRDGQIFSVGGQTFEFDSGFTLVAPGGAGFNIQDGETFTIDDGINPAVTFEFDNNSASSVPAGQTIVITSQDSADTVAQKIATAIGANFALYQPGLGGITPHVNGPRVNLEGAIDVTQTAPGAPRVTLQGAAGVSFGTPVVIHEGMTDVEVARQIALAIDAQFALLAGNTDLLNVQTTALLNNARIQLPTQIVTNPGPLATGNILQGDQFGNFFDAGRGQRNNFEGAYIDDIMVGFAERGEMVTGATANATFFTTPADLTVTGTEQLTGDYQLEIRRGQDYAQVIDTATGQILPYQSFDTNDRLTKDFTITLPPGSQVHEGQSFQINDGLNTVTFEFDTDGLVSGSAVPVPYTSLSTAVQLAQVVANLINSNSTLSTLAEANVTGARVNLVQAAFVTSGGASSNGDLSTEPNDTIATAANSNLSSNNPGTFIATGTIGDNPNLFLDPSLDVDMVSFQLNAGDHVRIDLDAAELGSNLDGIISIFNSAGLLMAASDDDPAPGESLSLDAYLDFVAPADGVYYVGVSGFDNFTYDPNTAGSGTSGFVTTPPIFSQGAYTLIITVGSGAVLIDQYDFTGDENQFREQGQILIDGNHISNFFDTGIRIDAAPRDAEGNIPRQPSVRSTRETNVSRLVPGVAVQNNLITNVGQVGIRFSGSTNPAGQPVAAVPFGRIVNNTIWGGPDTTGIGIQVTDNASPTIVNNILANLDTGITVDNSSRTVIGIGPNGQPQVVFSGTVISANLYRSAATTSANTGASNGGLGDLPIVLSPADPLFEDESLGIFTPKKGSLAIDSSLDSVQDRPELTVVTNPLGIGLSPILAPDLDLDGKLRVDDPSQAPPPGLGSNVFKDRGALERIDQPLVSISSGSGTVTEGDLGTTDFVFVVSLDQFTSSLVTVEYMTTQAPTGPLAAGGVDYLTQKGVLTFLPGSPTTQFITVKVIGDALDEDDESFAVVLSNASNSAVLNGQATGQIIDDDDPPTIAINNVSLPEGNNPNVNTPFVFTVSLSQASGRIVNAVYNTSDVTATAGLDYQPTSGTLTFNPGQTQQFVTVNVFGDVIPESNETFNVTLSAPTNVTIPVLPATGGVGVGTIINDEPSLTINSVSLLEGNSGTTNFVFNVVLTPSVSTAITVQFATANGTATAGSDYTATSGTLTFSPSQTQQTIVVAVSGDTAVEPDETFTVNLTNATGAGITVGTGTGTIGNDDTGPVIPPIPPVTAPYIVTSAGATGGPHVHVVDAATLQTRYSFFAYPSTFTGGVQVATGDVNGDGIDDIITAPGTGGGPHVRVFSGATGQQLPGLIGSFMAFEVSYNGGVFVAAGDINFDGKADLFVATKASSSTFAGESASAARIRVFDGASGAQLREFSFRSGSPLAAGIRIASGDINGDGRPEILAASAAGGGGHVLVMDPFTGGILRDFVPYPGFNGEIFVTAGDMNRDGQAEIITGAGQGGGPQVNIYDGATNTKLRQFFAYASTFTGGVRVGASDINADGVQDLILGAGTTGGPHVKVLNGTNLAEIRSYFAYAPTFTGGVFVAGSGGGSPLMAAGGQASDGDVATLTQEALQPIVQDAIARWAGANISASALERLRQTPVSIADLPDGFLGLARPDRIYVDINGAGYGWFIDPTPGADEEFGGVSANNRMDLLTTVMHEMGHVLGLDDMDHDLSDLDLMTDSLAAGQRRTPSHKDIDSIFANDEDWQ